MNLYNTIRHNMAFVMSLMLLVLSAVFWLWLIQQNEFLVGHVTDLIATPNLPYQVAKISNLLASSTQQAVIPIELVHAIDVDSWVLAYGPESLPSGTLVISDIYSSQPIALLMSFNPRSWFHLVTSHEFIAITIAVVLILSAGRLNRVYTLIVSIFLAVTVWHAAFSADALYLINIGELEVFVLMALAVAIGILGYKLHDEYHLIATRTVAMFLALVYGPRLIAWFGIVTGMGIGYESFLALIVFILMGWFVPTVVTAILAGYLLGNALSASVAGTITLMALALLVSLSLNRDSRKRVKAVMPKSIWQYGSRAVRSTQPGRFAEQLKGKVTLSELLQASLNKRGARNE